MPTICGAPDLEEVHPAWVRGAWENTVTCMKTPTEVREGGSGIENRGGENSRSMSIELSEQWCGSWNLKRVPIDRK